ncbi:hypothetical protein Tco_0265786 [Tanacetum coccineum]
MNLLEKHLTNEILHEIDCQTALTKFITMFENIFNSKLRECRQNYTAFEAYSVKDTIINDMAFIEKYILETILHQQEILQRLNEKKLWTQEVHSNIVQASNVDSVVMENTSFGKEYNNSETAFSNSTKERNLDSKTKDVHAIKYKMSKAKQRCMIPTGKLLDSCTSKVDSEPPYGSNTYITNPHECKQTLDLSAYTSINVQKEQTLHLSAASHHNVNKSSYIRYDSYDVNDRFGKSIRSLFDGYFNGENLVVSKSSVVTTADASDKRQQQLDSTSSTSTLATTVTADENFDL